MRSPPPAAPPAEWVDFLCERWSYQPECAYVLCSAAMDLRFAQVVNQPVHTVTASLPKALFADAHS